MNKKMKTSLVIAIALVLVGAVAYSIYSVGVTQPLAFFKATIYYTDGTSKTYSPNPRGNPLVIVDPSTNKIVSYLQVELYVKPIFQGTVKSWTVSTRSEVRVYDAANLALLYTSPSMTITGNGGAIQSNQAFVVKSSTINAAVLESMCTYVSGRQYYYAANLVDPLTMTLTFSDNSIITKSQPQTSNFYWLFRYEGGYFESLSVSWGFNPS